MPYQNLGSGFDPSYGYRYCSEMDFDFFTPAYEYKCLVGHTADGDTLDLVADLGLRASLGERVRLYGVNTP